MKKIIAILFLLGAVMANSAQAQYVGQLMFPNQASAQAFINTVDAWLYANDADWKTSVDMGMTLTWDTPHQTMIFDPVTEVSTPDPMNTQWWVYVYQRMYGALTPAQQAMVTTPGAQNNLLNESYGSITTDSATGLRSY